MRERERLREREGGERGLLWRFASVAFCWVALLVKEKKGEKIGRAHV